MQKGILALPSDRPRSGSPGRISIDQKNQIAALACEDPKEYGIPFSRWTLGMLARVAIQTSIVDSISAAYVGEILRKKTQATKNKQLDFSQDRGLENLQISSEVDL